IVDGRTLRTQVYFGRQRLENLHWRGIHFVSMIWYVGHPSIPLDLARAECTSCRFLGLCHCKILLIRCELEIPGSTCNRGLESIASRIRHESTHGRASNTRLNGV